MVETDIAVVTLVDRVVPAIRSATDPLLVDLRAISRALQDSAVARVVSPRPRDFGVVADLVLPFLRRQAPLVEGVGLAYAPGAFVDQPSWLDWWRCRGGDRPVYVMHDLDPRSISYYDYASREWFQAPRERGLPVAVGPYVDTGGVFTSTVRLAIPVPTASGVHTLGCDLSLAGLESVFVRAAGAVDPALALVGGGGRVLASNSARHTAGTRAAAGWASWHLYTDDDGFASGWTIRSPVERVGGRVSGADQTGRCAIRRSTSRVAAGVSGVADSAT